MGKKEVMPMASFAERMMGAALLDVRTFEEMEADPAALRQAMGVVVLSSIATGIGAAGHEGAPGLVGGLVAGLLGWAIWAWLTYFIGTRILPSPQTHADWGQLARTTGFAATPGILRAGRDCPRIDDLRSGVPSLAARRLDGFCD